MKDEVAVNTARFPGERERRGVEVSVLTNSGWIRGTIVLPKLNSFVDYLNTVPTFVKLTGVSMAGLAAPLPFLALAQNAYTLMIPAHREDRLRSVRETTQRGHSVSCLFAGGHVSGNLATASGVRVSDFLSHSIRFFLLSDCTLDLRGKASVASNVIVNGAHLVGITEPAIELSDAASPGLAKENPSVS